MTFWLIGDYNQAITDFNQAIELNPEDTSIYCIRGNFYQEEGNYVMSEKDFLKALELDPEYEQAKEDLRKVRSLMNK